MRKTTPSNATPSNATPSNATPSNATPSNATPGNATRRPARGAGGNAIIEMALVLPALMFLAMGMVEFGQFFYTKNAFQQAARDAARAAIMPNAKQADPYTAASATLAAAGVTFQDAWMTITDITPNGWGGAYSAGAVSDCSTVSAGHALTVTVQTTYGSLPNAVRPLYAVTGGVGIPSNRAIAGSSTALKE